MCKIKNLAPIDLVNSYKAKLKASPMVVLDAFNHIEHVAAYRAWYEDGGNIFVLNPMLDTNVRMNLLLKANKKALEVKNKVFFHTNGTTGAPKLVVHGKKQFDIAAICEGICIEADEDTKFLNVLPPFTSGFWFIVMPVLFKNNASLILIGKEDILNIDKFGAEATVLTPNAINFFMERKLKLDLGNFKVVQSGASPVLQKHIDFLFDCGLKKFNHIYGATEFTAPVLERTIVAKNMSGNWLNLKSIYGNKFELTKNGELLVSGESVCDNHEELGSVNGYLPTGDSFISQEEMIKFDRRLGTEKVLSCGKYSLTDWKKA